MNGAGNQNSSLAADHQTPAIVSHIGAKNKRRRRGQKQQQIEHRRRYCAPHFALISSYWFQIACL